MDLSQLQCIFHNILQKDFKQEEILCLEIVVMAVMIGFGGLLS